VIGGDLGQGWPSPKNWEKDEAKEEEEEEEEEIFFVGFIVL